MKKFLSILFLIIIIIAAGATFLGYKLTKQAEAYYDTNANITEKAIAWLREGRSIIRDQIEQNQTGTIYDILNVAYNTLTKQTQSLIAKTPTSDYIVKVQTDDMIVSYNIQIPTFLQGLLSQDSPAVWVTNIGFNTANDGEMLAGLTIMTTGDRQAQEKEWLLNIEQINTTGDLIVAYTRALGVSATGIELEIFSDLVHTIDQSVKSGTISNIEKMDYTMAYIQEIKDNSWSTTITIDPIEWFDGTGANEAFAKYDPTGCAASISGTTTKQCTPPNGYYIYNADTGTTIDLTQNNESDLELIDTTSTEGNTIAGDWTGFVKEFANKYTNIPFHIYYNADKQIIQLTEQYIP